VLFASLPTFLRTFLLALLPSACCCPPRVADRADDPALLADVQQIVADLGGDVRAAVWWGRVGDQPALAWNVETPMPAASAIKAAYLAGLVDACDGALGDPLPCADEVFDDADHPAIEGFSAAEREEAEDELGGESARSIGEAMISVGDNSNATYNIAANLVTACCGGPAGLDNRLDERWCDLEVRRYMLADRHANGDNEATAHAMAAVHSDFALRSVDGLSAASHDACREILARGDDADGRPTFGKTGALDSEPVTRVRAGWREAKDGPWVHVVMLARDGAADRPAAGEELEAAALDIERLLVASLDD
jgi:hypothetical protein